MTAQIELEDAKTKLESLVVYLAKQRHAAKENYVQADNALTDITSVLVTLESTLLAPANSYVLSDEPAFALNYTPIYNSVPSPTPRYSTTAENIKNLDDLQ